LRTAGKMAAPTGVSCAPRRERTTKLGLEGLLQHLDLLGERRLGHAQPLGGTAEVLLFGHGEEQPQMTHQAKVDHRFHRLGVLNRSFRIGIYRTMGRRQWSARQSSAATP
jgi:hypothetical protein